MKTLPKTRTKNIVVQALGKETLVYDLITHKAYNLNETSAIVFNNCDGKTSFDELKRQHKFTDDLIYLALDELKKNNLIEDPFDSPFVGINRREVIRRVGLASMIALPVIASLTAPTAAMAQSSFAPQSRSVNQTCNTSVDCAASAPNCISTNTGVGADDIRNRCCVVSNVNATASGSLAASGARSQADCNNLPANSCCRGAGTTDVNGNCVCN